ncbi:LPXTG cell wall anchor domain-containing protein [Corynebacterium accolens]|uniref:LPXTG cell wall anchor domain-containing protein n=1 Tax=Corynebacterium accolens TaxID=38284 RepID=UPI00254A2BCC|nr:LPXTG cell wall anchor domain-containing protein [Corynebacterium accolens]MDK8679055.1 LPXTG cell wall anchor domain-containing protein [Corynebacterium accolens]
MDTDKTKVKPGDTVNAHVEVEGEAPYPESGSWTYGKSDVTAVIFVLQVDPKLTVPSVDKLNFKWGDGKQRTPFRTVPYPDQNAVLLEFSARDLSLGPKPSFSLDFPATVNKSVKDGEKLGVTVQTEMTIRPTLDWTYGDWEMRDIGQACFRDAEGTLSFENPGHYGTWMADLWLGTDVDHFKLNGKPEFKVTGPDGKDLTNTVFPSDAYPQRTVNPIAKPTIYTGSDATDFNGYRWLSRYQWKINEENLAGDVWIPEGSTIRVKQRVESTECSFNPSQDNFGVKVESRNAPLAKLDTAQAALTVDENPEAPTPSETEPKPDTEKESEPSSTSSTPSTEATTTSDSPEPSEPTEPTEPSEPSEPSETTPNEDGETTVTTTEPETEAPEPEEDPEPSSPSSTTSTEVTTTSETPASSTTETTTKTTTPTCKPSESESPKPSDPSEPSKPSEPTPSESGKTTVPSTEPESEDPDCEPSGSPEPTPSSTTTPTLPQPLLPVPLLPLGKNKDEEPSTTPEKPKSSEPKGTEPQEPGKQQETTHPQNGSQSHAATSTTAPAPAKGDHSQRTTGLANTGASVIGLVIAGIMAIAGGLFLVRRNRNA